MSTNDPPRIIINSISDATSDPESFSQTGYLVTKILSIKKRSAASPCQQLYVTICLGEFSGMLLHGIRKKAYEKTKIQAPPQPHRLAKDVLCLHFASPIEHTDK